MPAFDCQQLRTARLLAGINRGHTPTDGVNLGEVRGPVESRPEVKPTPIEISMVPQRLHLRVDPGKQKCQNPQNTSPPTLS